MRERLQNFMRGRNGYDAFSRFIIWLSVALLIVSLFTGSVWSGRLSSILWILAVAAVAYSYYRVLSKNIYRRQAENAAYLQKENRVKAWFRGLGQRWRDRKSYKYFRCPSCKASMRVPRHKGRLRITCKACGRQFEGKT